MTGEHFVVLNILSFSKIVYMCVCVYIHLECILLLVSGFFNSI